MCFFRGADDDFEDIIILERLKSGIHMQKNQCWLPIQAKKTKKMWKTPFELKIRSWKRSTSVNFKNSQFWNLESVISTLKQLERKNIFSPTPLIRWVLNFSEIKKDKIWKLRKEKAPSTKFKGALFSNFDFLQTIDFTESTIRNSFL